MNYQALIDAAKAAGFTSAGPLDVRTIRLYDEVRAMCSANACGQYARNWSCPPHCGSIQACREKIAGYKHGLLVQTVGEMEDCFDAEAIQQTERAHKAHFLALCDVLVALFPKLLPLSAGCCTRCDICSCPDAPCRFPEKKLSSMEAYGMMVQEVCKANNLAYYYGTNTIAFTSCFLLC